MVLRFLGVLLREACQVLHERRHDARVQDQPVKVITIDDHTARYVSRQHGLTHSRDGEPLNGGRLIAAANGGNRIALAPNRTHDEDGCLSRMGAGRGAS